MIEIIFKIIRENSLQPPPRQNQIADGFQVYVDNNFYFSLERKMVEEIHEILIQKGCQSTHSKFKEIIKELKVDFYNMFCAKFCKNNEEAFLLTIASDEPKILSLPWEVLNDCNNRHLSNHSNVLFRRVKLKTFHKSEYLKFPESGRNCFYSNLQNLHQWPREEDISNDIINEMLDFKRTFGYECRLFPAITEEQLQIEESNPFLIKDKNIVHIAGHGNEKGFIINLEGGQFLTIDQLKGIDCNLLFMNFCSSARQYPQINSLAYEIISNGKAEYVIGMSHRIKTNYALNFSKKFYSTLCEHKSILTAFLAATNIDRPTSAEDYLYPILYQKII